MNSFLVYFYTVLIICLNLFFICIQMVQNVHVNQKIRKLLAIGKRFAVVLLPYVDNKYKNLG